jgi:uncharacterized UPF0160 family protein
MLDWKNEDFIERVRHKLYTNLFHFIDAIDNNSLSGFNPKFEIRTTFDYQIRNLNSSFPIAYEDINEQFMKGMKLAKEELVSQTKEILNDIFYFDTIKNAISERFDFHRSGRAIYTT